MQPNSHIPCSCDQGQQGVFCRCQSDSLGICAVTGHVLQANCQCFADVAVEESLTVGKRMSIE